MCSAHEKDMALVANNAICRASVARKDRTERHKTERFFGPVVYLFGPCVTFFGPCVEYPAIKGEVGPMAGA